ncbi:type III secretion system export apparatus subunit SctT [Trinickia diaoshuihuensis]|uniref:type III secretion system export apparatus subunit SctT n=1 Tax=Trinickia diaoshuihuensis TaxID=2292265 RepID=UPI0013C2A2F1|nr:type III secretion system export apparatus subunit SctT [Trinickia diaoshuihuensis]
MESALPFVAALALCSMRWLPAIFLVPIFRAQAMNGLARSTIALALALPAASGVAGALSDAPLPLAHWLALTAKEAALGIIVASLVAVPFWAVEAAGTYLDYQRGANPQALDPAMSVDASVLGGILQQALIVYLIASGGLHAVIEIVSTSYIVWPALAGFPPLGPAIWAPFGTLLAATMQFALTLAAPYLLALAAIEACFAIVSRVNAKFPAYVAALPFKSVVVILLIAMTLPRLLAAGHDLVGEHGSEVNRVLRETAAAADRNNAR